MTASLSEEAINKCAVERMEKIEKKLAKKFRKCADNYSEEELNKMEEMGLKIQTYKCFKVWYGLVLCNIRMCCIVRVRQIRKVLFVIHEKH